MSFVNHPMLQTVAGCTALVTTGFSLLNNASLERTVKSVIVATTTAIALSIFAMSFGTCTAVGLVCGLVYGFDAASKHPYTNNQIATIAGSVLVGATFGYIAGFIALGDVHFVVGL